MKLFGTQLGLLNKVSCAKLEMTRRYKGRPNAKTIARDFPFIVEVAVPPGGLGKRRTGFRRNYDYSTDMFQASKNEDQEYAH
jgi:hypothetical protein